MAEFAERLAAALLDWTMAQNRVHRGWDVMTPTGKRVQVRDLANLGVPNSNLQLVNLSVSVIASANVAQVNS